MRFLSSNLTSTATNKVILIIIYYPDLLKIVKGKYMQSEQISHLRYRGKEGKTVPLLIQTRIWRIGSDSIFGIQNGQRNLWSKVPAFSLPPSQWLARTAVIMTFRGVCRLPSWECIQKRTSVSNVCLTAWLSRMHIEINDRQARLSTS